MRLEVEGQPRAMGGTVGPLVSDRSKALVGLLSFDEGAAPSFLVGYEDDDASKLARVTERCIRVRITQLEPKEDLVKGVAAGAYLSCTNPRARGAKLRTELRFAVARSDHASLAGHWLRINVAPASAVLEPYKLSSDDFLITLNNVTFQVVAPDPNGAARHLRALELDALDILKGTYLAERTQAWSIAVELARSAAQSVLAGGDREETLGAVHDVLKYARPVFRSAWGYDSSISDIWYSDAQEFREHRVYDEAMAAKYDELWRHFDAREAWHLSTEDAQPYGHGFDVREDGKQLVLQDFKDHRGLASPTLEWALADSLAYTGCIDFANAMGDKRVAAGRERDPRKSLARSGASHIARRTGILCIKAIGWLLLAWLIYAGSNWFLGSTAALVLLVAWIAWQIIPNLYRRDRPDPLASQEALLERMYAFSEALGKPDFSGVWAHLELKALKEAGAKFSPVLSEVLSMRAERERATLTR